jgi:hypothetical protein
LLALVQAAEGSGEVLVDGRALARGADEKALLLFPDGFLHVFEEVLDA